MTLRAFALLVGADPKWVLNAAAVVPLGGHYTLAAARRLAVARAIVESTHCPLPRAYRLAGAALRTAPARGRRPVAIALGPGGLAVLEVDVFRALAAVATRQALLATMHHPRRRGRKPSPHRDPVRTAEQYGLDLSLLRENLRRTPTERLRALDAMAAFRRRAKRVAAGHAA